MISHIISHILKLIFKEHYRSFYSLIFELFSACISVFIYYFTSKAFESAVSEHIFLENMDYFHFIMIGDIALVIPMFLLEGLIRIIRKSKIDGVYQLLNSLGIKETIVILKLSLIGAMPMLFRLLYTVIIFLCFSQQSLTLFNFLIIFIVGTISFAPFGIITLSFFLMTGRGAHFWAFVSSLLAILSGSLFPVHVLPELLRDLTIKFNPITNFLFYARKTIWIEEINMGFLNLNNIFFLLFFYCISFSLLKGAIWHRRKKGELSIYLSF